MSNFNVLYKQSVRSGLVSPKLRPLLECLYSALVTRPVDQVLIKQALVDLLSFLTTVEGRTDGNVRAVDYFVTFDEDWEKKWTELPKPFVEIIEDIGGGLHDTISNPDVAKVCEATPEQLLHRTNKLRI